MPEAAGFHGAREEPFRLDGLTAVITGASRGIGEGCAKLFARQGAHVVLVARDASVLAVPSLKAAYFLAGHSEWCGNGQAEPG
jgi:NAD(P)-dependent dehydrogenase (short-subunit alcohol dehydrogenase family)